MKLKFEYQIALGYLVISGLWIFLSDYIIFDLAADKQILTHLQTYKGWFFVLTTGFLLFLFVRKHLSKQRQIESQLVVNNKQLEAYQIALKEKADDYYSLLEEYKTQNEDLLYSKNESDRQKERFSFLLDYAPDPIIIFSENIFRYTNQKAIKIFGYTNEKELIGESIFNVFKTDDEQSFVKDFEQVKTQYANRIQRQFTIVKSDNENLDVEASAVPIVYDEQPATLVFLRDITQSKKYLKEIEEKKVFIETVLDNLPIGLAMNKLNEGQAAYMNKKFIDVYGWPEEELVNIESFFEKVYPDAEYREEIKNRISQDIAKGDLSLLHWENIIITQENGEKRVVNAVNIPLFEQNTMISTVIDVTELKRVEQNLLEAKEKAEESDRLKTAFLNNISHEFRTPLNGILGFVEMIIRPGISEEKKQKYVSIIKESTAKLVDIITDTVEISHIQAGASEVKKRSFSLGELIEEICKIYEPIAHKKEIKLNTNLNLAKSDQEIISDRHKLFRILQHLADNAVKFTEKGRIDILLERNNSLLEIKVSDTGVGITPDTKETMFDVFRQSELGYTRSFGGNGIGLFIVKSYVSLLDGEITLESELNKGSTFTVQLPMYQV